MTQFGFEFLETVFVTDDSFAPRLDAMPTRWSLIQRAHGSAEPAAENARRVLVLRYAPAIKNYVRGITQDESLADELSQEIVVRLMQGDFAGADPERGQFRNFLKTAIRNMVRNHWGARKNKASTDIDLSALAAGETEWSTIRDPWEERWKTRLLELAWAALNEHQQQHPQSLAHSVLRLRADFPDETSEQIAERLSTQIGEPVRPDTLRQKLRRARVLFAEFLVRELVDGLSDPAAERVEDELIQLNLYDQVQGLLPEGWSMRSTE